MARPRPSMLLAGRSGITIHRSRHRFICMLFSFYQKCHRHYPAGTFSRNWSWSGEHWTVWRTRLWSLRFWLRPKLLWPWIGHCVFVVWCSCQFLSAWPAFSITHSPIFGGQTPSKWFGHEYFCINTVILFNTMLLIFIIIFKLNALETFENWRRYPKHLFFLLRSFLRQRTTIVQKSEIFHFEVAQKFILKTW